MASIRIRFIASKISGIEGEIYYQVTHKRKMCKLYSGYKVFFEEWDKSKCMAIETVVSDRYSYLTLINEKINSDIELFKRIISKLSIERVGFTVYDIINEYNRHKSQQSFFNFMKSVIKKLKELGRQRTSETYTSALNSFMRFRNNMDLLIDEFDSDLMEKYEAYLSHIGLIPNTTSFYMRILRAVYNRAIEKGLTSNRQPFRHVYTGIDKTVKRAIDIRTIRKIKEIELTELSKIDFARDMFMLSFYFRGMSFVDMSYLRKSDLAYGQLTYRRRKTGQRLSIKWTKEMQQILDKYKKNETEYLLPIITSTTANPHNQYREKQYLVNKGLKSVAEKIGLKMSLTMYCSRHSWASVAKSKGIPISVISDGLGHDSESTTKIYLSTLDTSAVDKANALIIKLL